MPERMCESMASPEVDAETEEVIRDRNENEESARVPELEARAERASWVVSILLSAFPSSIPGEETGAKEEQDCALIFPIRLDLAIDSCTFYECELRVASLITRPHQPTRWVRLFLLFIFAVCTRQCQVGTAANS